MVPNFVKGIALAPSGSTFQGSSGLVPHPLQKSGKIPLLGSNGRFKAAGSSVTSAIARLAKIPGPSGPGGTDA